MSMVISKNTWSPTLDEIIRRTGSSSMRRYMGDLGARISFAIKSSMENQHGFANHVPYAPLKIEFRYDGRKQLINNAGNFGRRARGATAQAEVIGGKSAQTIGVSRRVPVAPGTTLFHTGMLHRTWDVLSRSKSHVEIGNLAPAEREKAFYNDDRGEFGWGVRSIQDVENDFGRFMDRWLR